MSYNLHRSKPSPKRKNLVCNVLIRMNSFKMAKPKNALATAGVWHALHCCSALFRDSSGNMLGKTLDMSSDICRVQLTLTFNHLSRWHLARSIHSSIYIRLGVFCIFDCQKKLSKIGNLTLAPSRAYILVPVRLQVTKVSWDTQLTSATEDILGDLFIALNFGWIRRSFHSEKQERKE